MNSLQELGKRLDQTLELLRQTSPKLEYRFTTYVTPKFLNLIDSNTSLELEMKIIKGMNGWIDLMEMELKGLFEIK